MKQTLIPTYSRPSFNLATLTLRLSLGFVMFLGHGWGKVMHFSDKQERFVDFMSLGPQFSLILVIIAEFICSILIILGLFTRVAAVILIVNMLVAISLAHSWQIIGEAQLPFLFLAGYVSLLLLGSGKISLDNFVNRR
ncbi:MAG TPA: DoxX family protein [Chitinophagaceae bacterium]|nr:DoxX family protein [Chitinophagaceae bacterium]